MISATPPAANVEFDAELRITRWKPLVQWFLAIPHFIVAETLGTLRCILTVVGLVCVVFTERMPRSLFDAIAMTHRYEWRALSYALFLHEDYPPFDFRPGAVDDGLEPHTTVTIAYPERLDRWKPLYKWFLAIPHYVVAILVSVGGLFVAVWGLVAVAVTGNYPRAARDYLVGAYRYGLRVMAYVGLLTDEYPPFRLAA